MVLCFFIYVTFFYVFNDFIFWTSFLFLKRCQQYHTDIANSDEKQFGKNRNERILYVDNVVWYSELKFGTHYPCSRAVNSAPEYAQCVSSFRSIFLLFFLRHGKSVVAIVVNSFDRRPPRGLSQ